MRPIEINHPPSERLVIDCTDFLKFFIKHNGVSGISRMILCLMDILHKNQEAIFVRYRDGRFERLIFYSVGETSCSDVIGRCFVDQVPALSIPCYGERRFGHAADDELAIGLPDEGNHSLPIGNNKEIKQQASGLCGTLSGLCPPAWA